METRRCRRGTSAAPRPRTSRASTPNREEHPVKAAVVHAFDQPLRVEEVATPEPATGQVVVKIETSGLCHTDIHAAHGDWPIRPTPPFVPGHEGVGTVERVGPGVADLNEGD